MAGDDEDGDAGDGLVVDSGDCAAATDAEAVDVSRINLKGMRVECARSAKVRRSDNEFKDVELLLLLSSSLLVVAVVDSASAGGCG